MSKIVLIASRTTDLGFLSKLRSITGLSIGELKKKLENAEPFWEALLFMNDHKAQDLTLRKIIDAADAHGVHLDVYELRHDEQFDSAPKNECKINTTILMNILRESDGFE